MTNSYKTLLVGFDVLLFETATTLDCIVARLNYYRSEDPIYKGTCFEFFWEIINCQIGVNIEQNPIYTDLPSIMFYLKSIYLKENVNNTKSLVYQPIEFDVKGNVKNVKDKTLITLVHESIIKRSSKISYAFSKREDATYSLLLAKTSGLYHFGVFLIDLPNYTSLTDIYTCSLSVDRLNNIEDAAKLFEDIRRIHNLEIVV